MRQIVIAGNWKLNCTQSEAERLVGELLGRLEIADGVAVVICPPFTALSAVGESLAGTGVALGSQDVFWKDKGAYTGQISAPMLRELGCRYAIVGHSERRGRFGVPEPDFDAPVLAYFGEKDEVVNRKLRAALAGGLTPICCVGETLAERHSDDTDVVVSGQVMAALTHVSAKDAAQLIFAYEPVWAIGTGETCAPDEADRVCGVVREAVGRLYGHATAEAVRVQYGGSVNAANAAELLAKPNIDGALVGGASLKPADFATIVKAANP